MNILVLTTRNIYDESGEKTLMLSKDRVLRKNGVKLFYYSLRRKFDKDTRLFNIIKQDSMYDLIFKKEIIKKNLSQIIVENKIDIIVVSGNWLLFLYSQLNKLKQKYNVKVSYDYQGAVEEVKEYKLFKDNQVLSNILFSILHYYEKKFISITDGVEAVSQNGIDYLKEMYGINFKDVIVHCGIEYPTPNDMYDQYRKEWREKYNLQDNDIACVYAGGIAKWQNIDEIIEKAKNNHNIKLYIYTSPKNQVSIKKDYQLSNNIYFDFLSHEELQQALCAFDYGFLLRNDDITNFVAFPNKYSDYVNARLKIVLKNKKIGFYPKDESRQSILLTLDDTLTNEKQISNGIYSDYIEYLSYDNMIVYLINYYKDL